MGSSNSRERRSRHQGRNDGLSPPVNMPTHLASQYNNRRNPANNGNTVPAPPRPDQQQPPPPQQPIPPQQQQQQQQQQQLAPTDNNNNNNNNNNANNSNNSNEGRSANNQRGVQEGQIVKMLATVDASSVNYDAGTNTLRFSITSVCPSLTYEIHTGVKEYIKDGEVFYLPNKPKMEPPRISLEGSQENKEVTVRIDVSKLDEKERVYNKHYPKQQPCVIVLRYRTKEMRKGKGDDTSAPTEEIAEHTEHTAVDLAENPKRRVISQIITASGGAYVVEDLFGVDGEVSGVVGGGAEVMLGTTIVPHEGDDDDDGLCVICLTMPKDTAVMPCRHMCLCKNCAEELMRHMPKCPVCRGSVSTLLHMPSLNDGEHV
ncbi:uncharacterized protein TM35_000034620 [Trypanosoma theileri]|uniref:RING-type domain-containing protein n=1 Tax=Trypanosoma theileri TaxID=67003 RepID=A0A1X0P805_9TRYP|nr:uncharacterized protein TM35_000034620 [Trypanosoma theileri]ORC92709.1 hypothetical protein TM35_000034620 [Trypanosoma theileri]